MFANGFTNLDLERTAQFEQSVANRLTFDQIRSRLNGFQNLPPEIIDRMKREIEGIGPAFVDVTRRAAWRAIPDSFEVSANTPMFSVGVELSKDGNVFVGGQVSYGSGLTDYLSDIKSANRAIYPRLSAGPAFRYFDADLAEPERDNAISGPDYELQIKAFTLTKPMTGPGPRSLKIGRPGYGIGGSYTSSKWIDGGDELRRAREFFYQFQR